MSDVLIEKKTFLAHIKQRKDLYKLYMHMLKRQTLDNKSFDLEIASP